MTQIDNHIVTSFIKKYDTDGHAPYLVLTDTLEKCVLKTCNNQADKISLTKEFLCALLLDNWEIETPPFCSLTIDSTLNESPFVITDKGFKYSSLYFGSKHVDSAFEMNEFIAPDGKVATRKILNISQLFDIALFDIWVENDDRRPSNNNLLLCPYEKDFVIRAIDHAYTFGSIDFLQINPEFVSFSHNDSILYSEMGKSAINCTKLNSKWLDTYKEKFYLCIQKTENSFQHACELLPYEFQLTEKERIALNSFLFCKERNKKVFDLFSSILTPLS